MIALGFNEAAAILGLESPGPGHFAGITTDSRAVEPGMLFAALPGDRVDGHDFAATAVAKGAVALLVQKPLRAAVPVFLVNNVLQALGGLAEAWRQRLSPRVAAITGSNGKTTSKEMLASILTRVGQTLATSGNYNNELGLPLTLFELEGRHDFAVLEMGASKAGDIRYLAGIAKPDVGVVTNVGPAHLKGFGTEEGVARAKGELYEALPPSGFAVLNSEEPWCDLWRNLSAHTQVLTFGQNPGCDVAALADEDFARVHTPVGKFTLSLALPGEHNVMNALCATTMALALATPLETIADGLAATTPVPGRLNLLPVVGGWTVIDDSYNANPSSLKAALRVLKDQPGDAWLVLGDMRELGGDSDRLHADMGALAARLGIQRLFALGPRSAHAARAFGSQGVHFERQADLVDALLDELHPDVTCLVKGSRSMGMEQVVSALTANGLLKEAG